MEKNRKFKLVLLAFFVATIAMITKLGTFSEWSFFVLGDFGFYFGANVYEKKVTGEKQ